MTMPIPAAYDKLYAFVHAFDDPEPSDVINFVMHSFSRDQIGDLLEPVVEAAMEEVGFKASEPTLAPVVSLRSPELELS